MKGGARTSIMLAMAAMVGLGDPARAGEAVAEPADYRMDTYLAPVPGTLAGATVLDTEAAHALWEQANAVFIDVFPQAPKPPNLPPKTIWQVKPRDTVKGAIWLPNTGYGRLPEHMDAFFRKRLAELSGGDPAKPLVFFCQQDCWMSWNAGKRALEYGYKTVYWYPDGMDGWDFADHETETALPQYP
jgi:PQQ-dependent catabolism-associated CXXCW motif protein